MKARLCWRRGVSSCGEGREELRATRPLLPVLMLRCPATFSCKYSSCSKPLTCKYSAQIETASRRLHNLNHLSELDPVKDTDPPISVACCIRESALY
jgi:hypothetical protein